MGESVVSSDIVGFEGEAYEVELVLRSTSKDRVDVYMRCEGLSLYCGTFAGPDLVDIASIQALHLVRMLKDAKRVRLEDA